MQRSHPRTARIVSRLTSALDTPPTGQRRRFDAESGTLVAGECPTCGAQTWPRRSVCYRCGGAEVGEVVLPRVGRLTTWTRVWVPVEGIDPPYVVGLVTLGRLQLFGHIRGVDEDTRVPTEVTVRVNPDEKPPFWFEFAGT